MIKEYDEITEKQFLPESIASNDVFTKMYSQYPAWVTRTLSMIAQFIEYAEKTFVSLTLGLIIGTAIYMLLDKEKKRLKIAILIYIISIVILGFVEGLLYVSGDNLTILEYWTFPEEYIVPVSIAFVLVVAVRYIRQKDIANKLNEKLKQIKEEKSK